MIQLSGKLVTYDELLRKIRDAYPSVARLLDQDDLVKAVAELRSAEKKQLERAAQLDKQAAQLYEQAAQVREDAGEIAKATGVIDMLTTNSGRCVQI